LRPAIDTQANSTRQERLRDFDLLGMITGDMNNLSWNKGEIQFLDYI
jgi:hypothetical protein